MNPIGRKKKGAGESFSFAKALSDAHATLGISWQDVYSTVITHTNRSLEEIDTAVSRAAEFAQSAAQKAALEIKRQHLAYQKSGPQPIGAALSAQEKSRRIDEFKVLYEAFDQRRMEVFGYNYSAERLTEAFTLIKPNYTDDGTLDESGIDTLFSLSRQQMDAGIEEERARYKELADIRSYITNEYKITDTFYAPFVEVQIDDKTLKHRKTTCLNLAGLDKEKTYNLSWRTAMLEEERHLPFACLEGADRIYFKEILSRDRKRYIAAIGEKKVGNHFEYAIMTHPTRQWVAQLGHFLQLHTGQLGFDESSRFNTKIVHQLYEQSYDSSKVFDPFVDLGEIDSPLELSISNQPNSQTPSEILFEYAIPEVQTANSILLDKSFQRLNLRPSHVLTEKVSATTAYPNLGVASLIALSKKEFPKSMSTDPWFSGKNAGYESLLILKSPKTNGGFNYKLMRADGVGNVANVLTSDRQAFINLLSAIQSEGLKNAYLHHKPLINALSEVKAELEDKYHLVSESPHKAISSIEQIDSHDAEQDVASSFNRAAIAPKPKKWNLWHKFLNFINIFKHFKTKKEKTLHKEEDKPSFLNPFPDSMVDEDLYKASEFSLDITPGEKSTLTHSASPKPSIVKKPK